MSLLLEKRKSKKTVLFLCTGDTCRGPMARGYLKHVLDEKGVKNFEIRSAGVMTVAGLVPTAEAIQVMKNAGVDIDNHRSTPLSKELLRKADIILGMTPFHVQFAMRENEAAKDKIFLMKEYAESDLKNYQINDPMGLTLEVYKRVYREMKLAIDKMVENKDFFTTPVDNSIQAAIARAKTDQEDESPSSPPEKSDSNDTPKKKKSTAKKSGAKKTTGKKKKTTAK